MPLEVLGVEVGFCAVRARELSVGILLGNLVLRRCAAGGGSSGLTRRAREDAATALGANHVGGLITLGKH